MSVCLYVYVASKWWSSVYLEDLAVKCVSCVCLCGWCDSVFLQCGGKNYNTASVLAVCVEYAHWRLQWCLAECECVYPWWWLRYNNVWLYQTVSMIVLGWECVLCGCVYAIVTKTVFGSMCESALQRWQSCFSFFCYQMCVSLFSCVCMCAYGCEGGCNSTGCLWALAFCVWVRVWQPGLTWC